MKLKLTTALWAAMTCMCNAAWLPQADQLDNYTAIMKIVNEADSVTKFSDVESKVIGEQSDAYLAARWKFVRTIRDEKRTMGSVDKNTLNAFLGACKKNGWYSTTDKRLLKAFYHAARAVAMELITDKPKFKADLAGLEIINDVAYATYGNYKCRMDVYLPKKRTAEQVPCVIYIHGGAWRGHKRAFYGSHAAITAKQGYVSCTIDYRLVPSVTPLECLNDAKAAVRFIRANAKKYGVDPNRIGVAGGSAGGQLTAALATTADISELEGNGGNPGVSSRVQAAVAFATPAMTGKRASWPLARNYKPGGKLADWYTKVSPYMNATEDDAPMMFIHGGADDLVKPDDARDMYAKYQELGIKTALDIVEGEGHAFYMNEKTAMKAFRFFEEVF